MSQEDASARQLDTALWIGVGAGVLADSYLLWAWSGWFVRSPFGLLWPLTTAAALAVIVALCFRQLPARSPLIIALASGAALFSLAIVVLNLVPPIARDELTHHLAIPLLFVRAGRVVEVPFADQAYYPMLVAMLYTPLLAHAWENTAKYLHFGFGLASSAVVYLYLRPRVPTWLALFAAVLLLSTPTVAVLGASAYVDLGLLFYATVAIIALLRWSETQKWSHFALCALAAGLAATVKYNGLLVIPLLACGVVLLSPRRDALVLGRLLVAFGALSLLPLLPWLVKNFGQTGNPIYPLLSGVFGGRPLPEQPSIDVFSRRHLLYGESWLAILTSPIRVFLTGREGDPVRFDGVFNPLYLLGFAAALLPGATRRSRVLAGFAAAFLLLVFFLAVFRSRYALPVLPVLAILSAEEMARWLEIPSAANNSASRLGQARVTGELPRQGRRPWRAVCAAVALGALLFNAAHLWLFWKRVDPLAYVSGRQDREEFIARFVPEYPVAVYANTHLPPDAKVHLAFLGQRGYYWELPYTYDFYYSGILLREAIQSAAQPGDIGASLRDQGISHIAAAEPLLNRFMSDNLNPAEYQRWLEFAAAHLRLLYRHEGIGLYEII